MTTTRAFVLPGATIAAVLAACAKTDSTVSVDTSSRQNPGVHRQYGTPQKVGSGTVRTYAVLDEKNGGAPLEIGVALSEDALQGLPAPPHFDFHFYRVEKSVRDGIVPSDPLARAAEPHRSHRAVSDLHEDLHLRLMGRRVHL